MVAPDDQRRTFDRIKICAERCQLRFGAGSVELEDCSLRPLIEVIIDRADELIGQRTGREVRFARELFKDEAVTGAHQQLADSSRAPSAGNAVPAVARKQRYGVDDYEPLDFFREALRPAQPNCPPVVNQQLHAIQLVVLAEPFDEAVEAFNRVVAIAALAAAAKAGKVGREAAG